MTRSVANCSARRPPAARRRSAQSNGNEPSTAAPAAIVSNGRPSLAGPAVSDRGLGGSVHIALPKQRDGLRHTVNQAIATIRADGTFQRIVRHYLPLGLD